MPGLEGILADPRAQSRFLYSQPTTIQPFALDFTAEGGVSGNPVSISDTGNGNPFDAVSIGTGATFAYDNSTAANGSQSILVQTGATATTAFARWTGSVVDGPQLWASVYTKFNANPSSSMPFIFPRIGIDAGAFAVRIHTDGTIRVYDTSSTFIRGTVGSIPLGTWFRIDCMFSASPTMAAGQVKLFRTPWSATPDEVMTAAGFQGGDSIFTGIRFGVSGGNVANIGPFWIDDPRANNVGYPDAVSPVTITLTDPGSGSDSISNSVSLVMIEPGSGSDALAVAASLSLSDSATSSDVLTDSAPVTLADAGSAADAIVAAITAILPDSGTGVDSMIISQPKTLTDTGSGADAIAVSVVASLGDLGEGVDAVVQYFKFGDSGQGSDSAIVSVTVSLADAGSGTDSLVASPLTIVNLSDSGVGTDTLVVVPDNTNTVTLSDSGSGSDAISVSPVIRLQDSGHGADSIVITVQMWLGFDDPVPEGHAPFDPAEFVSTEAKFTPAAPVARDSVTIVRQTWDMTPELFLAHMYHMHNGRDVSEHKNAHLDGPGGEPRHFHG